MKITTAAASRAGRGHLELQYGVAQLRMENLWFDEAQQKEAAKTMEPSAWKRLVASQLVPWRNAPFGAKEFVCSACPASRENGEQACPRSNSLADDGAKYLILWSDTHKGGRTGEKEYQNIYDNDRMRTMTV